MSHEPGARPNETPAERADRNFVEMLQGFRVAVTGVQVLFAFLLTVPFAQGFTKADHLERRLYYLALVTAALASLLFIAPVAQHRVLFQQGHKQYLVRRSNLYGICGTASLAVSVTTATFVVTDYIFHGLLPALTAAVMALLAAWLWFVEPLSRRRHGSD